MLTRMFVRGSRPRVRVEGARGIIILIIIIDIIIIITIIIIFIIIFIVWLL